MNSLTKVYGVLKEWVQFLCGFLQTYFISDHAMRLEILALRSQLALYQNQVENGKRPKPSATPAFRQLWVVLSKHCNSWRSLLAIFQPATVVRWHRTAFKFHWKRKSRKKGRPPIAPSVLALIKRIHKENPLLSAEKIHEQLVLLGITDAPCANAMRKYFPKLRKPPSAKRIQSWKTFLKNHRFDTWGVDMFTMPTLRFEVLYVLVIIQHSTREIIHFAVTKHPDVYWLIQQMRNATFYDRTPRYLIHDNDSIFVSEPFQNFLKASGIKSKATSIHCPWQNPYAERVIGTLRRELLDHIVPLNEAHLHRLLKEYIDAYYNPHRTHQGIDCRTPIPSPEYPPTLIANTRLKATPVLNGLYHTYKKVA